MNEIRTIREALHYVDQYQGSKVVIKLGEAIVRQPETLLEVIKDIHLLRAVGMEVFIAHSQGELVEDKLFGDIPILTFRKTKDTSVDERIANLAIDLKAAKLVYVTEHDGVFAEGKLIRQAPLKQAQNLLEVPGLVTGGMREKLQASIIACEGGVPRIHIISGFREGALLKEILSCEGLGTMIYKGPSYQRIRRAKEEELLEIIRVLHEQKFAVPVAIKDITENLERILVFAVDREIHGCVITTEYKTTSAVEASYLSVSSSYEGSDALQRLLYKVTKDARRREFRYVFLDIAKNLSTLGIYPWFLELGFRKYNRKEFPWQQNEIQAIKAWVKFV